MTRLERQLAEVIAAAERDAVNIRPLRMTRDLNGFYDGQHLFLLLGGPSLASFDPALFRRPGIITMAVNNAAQVIRPTLWIGGDEPSRFLLSVWRDPTITKFMPRSRMKQALFDSSRWEWTSDTAGRSPAVIGYEQSTGWDADAFLADDLVRWGDGRTRLTMVAAIRVAASLGFCRIVLVGCDWQMSAGQPYAFTQARPQHVVQANNGYYREWSKRFASLRPILERAGVDVVNATPASHLQAFDTITIDDAIADAQESFGVDPTRERTEGMYTTKPPPPRAPRAARAYAR